MKDLLFLILLLLCFIVSFIYNKKDKFIKKFSKSFLHVFYLAVVCEYIAACFFSARYDLVQKYPNIPTVGIFHFLEDFMMYGIPLLYIIVVLILIKTDKSNDINQ